MDNSLTVSFVIPVRNDALRLQRCITSILQNDFPADRLEIIVVDNGSQDGSDAVAVAAGARLLSRPGLPVSSLRNAGGAAARGEILAFIDADHEIDPGWVACALEDLQRPGVAAVGAPYRAPALATWVQRSLDAMRHRWTGCCEVDWLASGNLAVWRERFAALGGFDTTLETCEDYDLCQRLRANGGRLLSDDRLKSVHFGDPATLPALFRAELWRGRDNLRAGLRGTLSLRSLPSLVIPVLDLGGLVLGTAGLAAAPEGLGLTLASAASMAALSSLRAAAIVKRRERGPGLGAAVLQAFAVACVYDLARALALVCRASHRVRRGETEPAI